jgi:hypothetical protein
VSALVVHAATVRLALLLVSLALTAPAAASTAELDPSSLVLREADVPAGFAVDREQTGLRANAREEKNDPRLRSLLVRWGRVTGYEVEFDRKGATIGSRADVLRTGRGARQMLEWYGLEARKVGVQAFVRSQVELGDEGWAYTARRVPSFTIVMWRSGRVFAGVGTLGLSKSRTLTLARAQQRRIEAALR